MFIFTRICMALCILTGDPWEEKPVPELEPYMADAVSLAFLFEVIGPDMHHDPTQQVWDFPNKTMVLRQAYTDACEGPSLEACKLFPSEKVIWEVLQSSYAFVTATEKRLEADALQRDVLQETLIEARKLQDVYYNLAMACTKTYNYTHRREQLRTVYDAIGAHNFYSGRLPPIIPVWRLPDAD